MLGSLLGGAGGGGGGLPPMQGSNEASQKTETKTSGESYTVIDNSMVIGGGGSLTRGSIGTPAGNATNAGGMSTNTVLIVAAAAVGVMVVGMFALRR